jgi:hypothetical protein
MNAAALPRLAIVAAVIAGSLAAAFPAGAGAKMSCEQRVEAARLELEGLPADPDVGRSYGVTATLSEERAVNPQPLLLAVRCPSGGRGRTIPYTEPSDFAEFRGTANGEGAYAFDVRFRRVGRWRVGALDVSGTFHDVGFYDVRPPAPATAGAQPPWTALIGAGGLAASTGMALVAWRRRRRRD